MPTGFELEEARALYHVVNKWVISTQNRGYREGFFEAACELKEVLSLQIKYLEAKARDGKKDVPVAEESNGFTEKMLRNRHKILVLNERMSHISTFRPWRRDSRGDR